MRRQNCLYLDLAALCGAVSMVTGCPRLLFRLRRTLLHHYRHHQSLGPAPGLARHHCRRLAFGLAGEATTSTGRTPQAMPHRDL